MWRNFSLSLSLSLSSFAVHLVPRFAHFSLKHITPHGDTIPILLSFHAPVCKLLLVLTFLGPPWRVRQQDPPQIPEAVQLTKVSCCYRPESSSRPLSEIQILHSTSHMLHHNSSRHYVYFSLWFILDVHSHSLTTTPNYFTAYAYV